MRDRLIAFVKESLIKHIDKSCLLAENITDDLLANGVIVPPCKVGDRLYQIVKMPKHTFVSEYPIIAEPHQIIYINVMGNHSCIPFEDFGKTVFLTREEAEQALKGGEEG